MDADLRRAPRKRPIYTENSLVLDGTWKIVDHDESLLALFPSDPPVYHRPQSFDYDKEIKERLGEFGAAETADGTLRLIGPDEAREVGLVGGTYRSGCPAAYLQKQLDIEAEHPQPDL